MTGDKPREGREGLKPGSWGAWAGVPRRETPRDLGDPSVSGRHQKKEKPCGNEG